MYAFVYLRKVWKFHKFYIKKYRQLLKEQSYFQRKIQYSISNHLKKPHVKFRVEFCLWFISFASLHPILISSMIYYGKTVFGVRNQKIPYLSSSSGTACCRCSYTNLNLKICKTAVISAVQYSSKELFKQNTTD